MEYSVYLIKPEGMKFQTIIWEMFQKAGLKVVRRCTFDELPAPLVIDIYRNVSPCIWKATADHLIYKRCEMGIVCGDDAVNRLITLIGVYTNPLICATGTIRSRFGGKAPVLLADDTRYFYNAIYRSETYEEVLRDIRLFRRFSALAPLPV